MSKSIKGDPQVRITIRRKWKKAVNSWGDEALRCDALRYYYLRRRNCDRELFADIARDAGFIIGEIFCAVGDNSAIVNQQLNRALGEAMRVMASANHGVSEKLNQDTNKDGENKRVHRTKKETKSC